MKTQRRKEAAARAAGGRPGKEDAAVKTTQKGTTL